MERQKQKKSEAESKETSSTGGLRPEVESLLDRSPSRCRVTSRLLPLPLRPLILQEYSTGDPGRTRGHQRSTHFETPQVTVIHTRTDPIQFVNAQNFSHDEVETELQCHSRSFTESSINRPAATPRAPRRHTSPLRPWLHQ